MLWLVTILALAATVHCKTWMTKYDKPFSFTCPQGQSLSHMKSAWNGYTKDRQFNFGCSPIALDATLGGCAWSGLVNAYDKPVVYQCPRDGIITGIYGIHDNHFEDRRWRFRCCDIVGYVSHACQYTGFLNKWQQPLDYTIPRGFYLRGVTSFHENHYEDRLTNLNVCEMSVAW